MESLLLIIWISITTLILVGGTFLIGFKSENELDAFDSVMHCLLVAMAWPLFLGIGLCVLPFYGIFLLGKKLKQTKQ